MSRAICRAAATESGWSKGSVVMVKQSRRFSTACRWKRGIDKHQDHAMIRILRDVRIFVNPPRPGTDMLTREENELLCRVEGDAPMGQLMRRHWLPACLIEEVPEPDGTPVAIRLLGEDLVAFRDSDG